MDDNIRREMSVRLTATRIMHEDHRLRAICDYAVAEAMRQRPAIGSKDDAERAFFEVARVAAALAIARVVTEDAEIAVLRIERDHYKEIALRALRTMPINVAVPVT